MSVPQNRFTTAPVRSDAACMCARGNACSSFAPGHAVHLIQARLVSATPAEWVDAIVGETSDGEIALHTLEGQTLRVWNGAGAQLAVATGLPVVFHPRYHALGVAGRIYNVVRV